MHHGDIQPKTVHLNEDFEIKLMDNFALFQNERSLRHKMMKNKSYSGPLSPEHLNRKGTPDLEYTSDIWAVGLTVLSYASRRPINEFYDWGCFRIDFEKIQKEIARLESFGAYSELLIRTIKSLLVWDPFKRSSLDQLAAVIREIEKEDDPMNARRLEVSQTNVNNDEDKYSAPNIGQIYTTTKFNNKLFEPSKVKLVIPLEKINSHRYHQTPLNQFTPMNSNRNIANFITIHNNHIPQNQKDFHQGFSLDGGEHREAYDYRGYRKDMHIDIDSLSSISPHDNYNDINSSQNSSQGMDTPITSKLLTFGPQNTRFHTKTINNSSFYTQKVAQHDHTHLMANPLVSTGAFKKKTTTSNTTSPNKKSSIVFIPERYEKPLKSNLRQKIVGQPYSQNETPNFNTSYNHRYPSQHEAKRNNNLSTFS